MSREEKIRDLMRRLMAMSPEPPPFPEEMTMARHEADDKRVNPLLVFAAAVAAVAALAVPLFLFLGGGGEPDVVATSTTTTVPSTIPPSTLPGETTTTTTTPATTTTTTVPMVEEWGGVVFLFQEPEDSFVGNPALVPVSAIVQGPFQPDVNFSHALAKLADGGLPAGFSNAIPSDVLVEQIVTDGDVTTAEMSEAFPEGAGGLLADFTMLNQLIYSITYLAGTESSVLFTVDGEPVEAFGSEGLDLTEPVGRDTFLDQLHMINLTEPATDSGEGYLVEGIANVFEATVSIVVLDGNGEVVHEEFVTATCGTGCWGEFSTTIDVEHVTPGESSIRLFVHSAQDGSVVEAITVPIPEDNVWNLPASS
ncbi:MAG TPA: Gmad2 immunoglobulin-like domain-containing protein [Acidimicrobiia bacterium]|nr:Gmad2 immunoglobulin-like domain-containing protein [Acidimicrobiia bacterium]